jgi:hypothetical protein
LLILPVDVVLPSVYCGRSRAPIHCEEISRVVSYPDRIRRWLPGFWRPGESCHCQSVTDCVQAIGTGHRHGSIDDRGPDGVDLALLLFTDGAGSNDAAAQVAQIGRYAAMKNRLWTVRAFREVLAQVTSARLVLCGVVEAPD